MQKMLNAEEWMAFQSATDIPWSTMYEKKTVSESKSSQSKDDVKEWSTKARHPNCPFEDRDVPLPIDQEGNINMDDYMWVKLTGILSPAERWELHDALDKAGVPSEHTHWPSWNLLRDILNKEDPESGIFYGHPQTGWMYFKDVATLILRALRNVIDNPKMKDIDILWKYFMAMVVPNHAAEMEVLVLRKDVKRQMEYSSLQASRSRNIGDQTPLIEGAPIMIRSVHKYKYCVDWQYQNICNPAVSQHTFILCVDSDRF